MNIVLRSIYDRLFSKGALLQKGAKMTCGEFLKNFFPNEWYQDTIGGLTAESQRQYVSWFMNANDYNKKPRRDLMKYLKKYGDTFLNSMEELCKANANIYHGKIMRVDVSQFSNTLQSLGEDLFLYLSSIAPLFLTDADLQQANHTLSIYLQKAPAKALSRLILTAALNDQLVEDRYMFSIIWPDVLQEPPSAQEPKSDQSQKDTPKQLYKNAKILCNARCYEDAFQLLEQAIDEIEKDRTCDGKNQLQKYTEIEAEIFLMYSQFLQEGKFCAKNIFKAYKCLEKCRNSGFPPILYALAKCYQSGEGCGANPRMAYDAMVQAANAGIVGAIYDLGDAYFRGEESLNCKQNLKKAEEYFKKGTNVADCGQKTIVAQCQYMLGKIEESKGNLDLAYEYYQIAAKENNILAKQHLWETDKTFKTPSAIQKPALQQQGICFLHNGMVNHSRVYCRI